MRLTMRKIVITVVGKDSVGIIARVCTYLADSRINILDISQTIVDGFFNMMMIVDTGSAEKDFDTLVTELDSVGQEMGCIIHAQREEIFDQMHRI
jgi:ACT domain-containing protein